MARILAIDPGNERSAYLSYWSGDPVITSGIRQFDLIPNEELLATLHDPDRMRAVQVVAIEMVASYGMPVGKEVFETCVWIGRFVEAVTCETHYVYRKDVKMHLCRSMKANDANIRAALIDRFGPGKEKAVGTKKNPGPLYGIKKDLWSALAVAVTCADTLPGPEPEITKFLKGFDGCPPSISP